MAALAAEPPSQSHGGGPILAREDTEHQAPRPYEAAEETLCFGRKDGSAGRLDERRSLRWFAPRKPRSARSGPDPPRVGALEAAGLMHESGRAKVHEARRHGLWHPFAAKAR